MRTALIGSGILIGALMALYVCGWLIGKVAAEMLGDQRFPMFNRFNRSLFRRRRR